MKASAGNWGKPNSVQKKVRVSEEIFREELPGKSLKKKKKVKKEFRLDWCHCPFCGEELKIDEKRFEEDKKAGGFCARWMSEYRMNTCSKCGAFKVQRCPACGQSTWFESKSRLYKHQGKLGCGFIGVKKEE